MTASVADICVKNLLTDQNSGRKAFDWCGNHGIPIWFWITETGLILVQTWWSISHSDQVLVPFIRTYICEWGFLVLFLSILKTASMQQQQCSHQWLICFSIWQCFLNCVTTSAHQLNSLKWTLLFWYTVLDVVVNKPFKDHLKQFYFEWLLAVDHVLTPTVKIKTPMQNGSVSGSRHCGKRHLQKCKIWHSHWWLWNCSIL
jgi:hypothetical protein